MSSLFGIPDEPLPCLFGWYKRPIKPADPPMPRERRWVLDAIASAQAPLSKRETARASGVPQGQLGGHLEALERASLIERLPDRSEWQGGRRVTAYRATPKGNALVGARR